MIAKMQHRRLDIETETQTYNHDWTPLGSSEHQCVIKCIATLYPTLEIITNTKIPKGPRTTERTDGRKDILY